MEEDTDHGSEANPGSSGHLSGEPGIGNLGDDAPGEVKKKKKKKKNKAGKDSKGIGSSRGLETMFRSAYRVHMDLTSLADSKANIMISINGLILSIILASIAPKIDSNNWLLFPTTIMLISCLAAIIYAIMAARPRLNVDQVTLDDVWSGKASLLFFGNYTQFAEDTYLDAMLKLADDQDLVYRNMMRDLYGIGSVLSRKFAMLHRSYTIFMFGLSISVLLFIIVFFMQTFVP
ncbi:MAG: hypothetical protein KDD65_08035 [Bacteroidetes bacterium]|nr:hypothetical protein [Bacteroidota bacterium]